MQFTTDTLLPSYVNNARIEITDDNVFFDFGIADPFEAHVAEAVSRLRARVVMNKSTFSVFAAHVARLQAQMEDGSKESLPVTILSRCPPKPGT